MKLCETKIEFIAKRKDFSFNVYHNLASHNFDSRYSIDEALTDWMWKTKQYTVNSFCRFVQALNPSFVCMSETQWKRINGTL